MILVKGRMRRFGTPIVIFFLNFVFNTKYIQFEPYNIANFENQKQLNIGGVIWLKLNIYAFQLNAKYNSFVFISESEQLKAVNIRYLMGKLLKVRYWVDLLLMDQLIPK